MSPNLNQFSFCSVHSTKSLLWLLHEHLFLLQLPLPDSLLILKLLLLTTAQLYVFLTFLFSVLLLFKKKSQQTVILTRRQRIHTHPNKRIQEIKGPCNRVKMSKMECNEDVRTHVQIQRHRQGPSGHLKLRNKRVNWKL